MSFPPFPPSPGSVLGIKGVKGAAIKSQFELQRVGRGFGGEPSAAWGLFLCQIEREDREQRRREPNVFRLNSGEKKSHSIVAFERIKG